MAIDKESHKILCTAFSNGKRHDFRLFKESKLHLNPTIKVVVDSNVLKLLRTNTEIVVNAFVSDLTLLRVFITGSFRWMVMQEVY